MEEPSEMKVTEKAPEENGSPEAETHRGIEFISEWSEEGEEEIRKVSFLFARDTVKPGDPLDLISCFCGFFASACFAIVLYFGITKGMSGTMLCLLPVYVLIAVFSLCRPLQVKISEAIWKSGFEKRIAVNKGYEGKVTVTEDEVRVSGKKGEEIYVNDSECFFFETDNYIILNITDRKLFPAAKAQLEEKGTLNRLTEFCINHQEKGSGEETEADGADAADMETEADGTAAAETEMTEADAADAADVENEADGAAAEETEMTEADGAAAAETEMTEADGADATGAETEADETAEAEVAETEVTQKVEENTGIKESLAADKKQEL